MESSQHKRQVVVTGIGVLSSLGSDTASTWNAYLAGVNGIQVFGSPIGLGEYVVSLGGRVAPHTLPELLSVKDARHMPPYIRYALVAGNEAIVDAGLVDVTIDPARIGVVMGSMCGGAEVVHKTISTILTKGPRFVSPRFTLNAPINMAAGELSIRFGFKGPQLAISTHGCTGVQTIGCASRLIQYGDADVMIAGATDAPLSEIVLAAFAAEGVLSKDNNPDRASRPFDATRNGFVVSEGAAMLVLEEREHAEQRGAKIYATLAGYGMSVDGYLPTTPSPDGEGLARAIRLALHDAGVDETDLQFISAFGESSQAGDRAEASAIARVFGRRRKPPLVSAPKAQFGHTMGAAGAIEAALTVLTVRHQTIAPTLHCLEPDKTCPIDISSKKQSVSIDFALTNSYGCGGNNAVLVWQGR